MAPLDLLFAFQGRIGRGPFAVGLAVVMALFGLGLQASLWSLGSLAQWLNPHGINAGFALNALWLSLSIVFAWSLLALLAKRMRDRGRSGWWALAVVVPLAAWAVLNDFIFLTRQMLPVSPAMEYGLILGGGVLAGSVLFEALALPGTERHAERR